jgi:ATP-binding cassette subfamily B protein
MASVQRSPARAVLGFLFVQWRRHSWVVGLTVLCTVLATLADVLVPLFAGRLVDAVTAAPDTPGAAHAAWAAFAAMSGLGAVLVALRVLSIFGTLRLTIRMMQDVMAEAFWRVQRFSTNWHANSFAGSVVRQVTRGAGAIDLLNDTLLFSLIPACIALAGSALVLGLRWPVMGALVLLGAFVFIASAVALSHWVGMAARLSNAWDTKLGGQLADAVTCNAVVKAFGAELREDSRLGHTLHKWRRRTRRTWLRGTISHGLQSIQLLGLRSAVTGLGVWLWWDGVADAGGVATVLTTYFVIHAYLQDIGQHIRNLQRSINEMAELVALHGQKLGVMDRPGARRLAVGGGEIRFDAVDFHYGDHTGPLFDQLSVTIAAGERVGLVGHSGSGKSSFVRLLQRLHDVTGGRILIDGQDIAGVTQDSLRAQLAIVPQEPILFHRSLAENIAYARPDATMDEIEAAARLANADRFIARLPQGYRTMVGERGVKLSGGERQRVAIARAFLADAPVLLLDEATASLDSESEAAIQDAMDRLIVGRTTIVVAHRLSTIRSMDRILVFADGRVVEEGSHASLVTRTGGAYRRLFERQALGLLTE